MKLTPRKPGIALGAAAAVAACALVIAAALASNSEPGYSRSVTSGLVHAYASRFDGGVDSRFKGWNAFIVNVASREPERDEVALLNRVNDFANVQPYAPDAYHWQAEDYWATPAEFYGSNGGDCEDYAIAKFFALKELGVPTHRMRIVYVMATRAGKAQPHMVLAYYPAPEAVPLILDNDIRSVVVPATQRPDLVPVYSFNDDDTALRYRRENPTQARRWKDLVEKLEWELRR
jgi:predicted transglutaminase-like cysteine proteinase